MNLKKINSNLIQSFIFVFYIIGFIAVGISLITILSGNLSIHFQSKKYGLTINSDYLMNISCASDSMGLIVPCKSKLVSEDYNNESLKLGQIYIYKFEDKWISHRLVACVDKDCNVTVFKGDNNEIAEFVNKSQIGYYVKGINYG